MSAPVLGAVDPVAAPGRPARLLLVEDNPADVAYVRALLSERHGFAAELVTQPRLGEPFGRLAGEAAFDCILLDLSLPDADGLHGLARVVALARGIPVVVLTGHANVTLSLEALRGGAEDYLVKGAIDAERLERVVRYAMHRASARRELAESAAFTRSVLDSLGAHAVVPDTAGVIVDVNSGWLRFANENGGVLERLGRGTDYMEVLRTAAAIDGAAQEALDGMERVLEGHASTFEMDYHCPTPREDAWFTMRVTRLPQPVYGAVVLHIPITKLKRAESALQHLALHDQLTGLPNRALLSDRLSHAIRRAAREKTVLAVFFIDVDEFKLVNDSYGHQAGDAVLQEVAERLERAVRPGDTVARFGGDEFVVVCEALDGDVETQAIAERLSAAVEGVPLTLANGGLTLGISIGIAVSDGVDSAPEGLLRDADTALYAAKDQGRGRHVVFDEGLRVRSRARLDHVQALRAAIESGGLELHYQPLVRLSDGSRFGYEALLRWHRPEVGPIDPQTIVDAAEASGLIVPLGAWVLATACGLAAQREDLGDIAVNVSARQFTEDDLVARVRDILADTGLAAERLVLELTESAVMEDLPHAVEAFNGLRMLGVRIALDDFGTGHASLSHLQELPVDALKIDRSFVAGLGTDENDSRVVIAVIQLAHAFGLKVLAEGIECEEQAVVLADLGCEHGQGYFFGFPSAQLPPAPAGSAGAAAG